MNRPSILRFLICVLIFLIGANLHAGLKALSGKRDVYRGIVERVDGKKSITIRVSPDDTSKTFPTCEYTELRKDKGYVDWDFLHVGSKVALTVITATEETQSKSLFVDGKLTVEIQIESSTSAGKGKSKSTKKN